MSASARQTRVLAFIAAVLALFAISASTNAATAQAACANAKAKPGTVGAKKAGKSVICLINKKRSAHGLRDVTHNDRLTKAALRHSRHMAKTECFAHECPGEPSLAIRLGAVGYLLESLLSWGYGENIAWGSHYLGRPKSIVKAWMDSPGHREIIFDGSLEEIGLGVVWDAPVPGVEKAGTYTADFGRRAF